MSINNGGPAFPLAPHTRKYDRDKEEYIQDDGMTLRDYFAAKALQGFCAQAEPTNPQHFANLAEDAYATADAMLRAREAS